MDHLDGLPRLAQIFPTDNYKGNTTIDIIAVHGIETHSPKTWTAYERQEEPRGRATNWLCDKDMLPEVMPQARIWTYDYNSNCYSDNAPQVDILELGETFLEILWRARDKDVGERPLIFVGSCFGGIVIAQALERASRDREYEYLLKSTTGVVFLGTPLRGTRTASIAQWVALIRGFMGKVTSDILLQSLKEKASSLDALVYSFSQLPNRHNFQIRCFYETLPTRIAHAFSLSRRIANFLPIDDFELVSKESACLDGHKRHALDVRHAMMNKFCGPRDTNFVRVSGSLRDIADNARISQHPTPEEVVACLQSFTSNYRQDKDRNEQRVPGTCEWFLQHRKFLSWQQKDTASLLWVSADPGCGKSVLARALVDEGHLSPDSRDSSVCYFFFKDDDASRQSGAQALCAVLHQLFIQKPVLLKHAMNTYRINGKNLCSMFRELWDVLIKCGSDPDSGEVICLLDALDECKKPARDDLITQLSWFNSAQNNTSTKLKFLATSRPYSDIERQFYSSIDDLATIRLEGEGEDELEKISNEINLVINHQVSRIAKSRKFPLKPEVQAVLIRRLKGIPHRTYLWLHLVLDIIRKSFDSREVRFLELINKLPRSVEDAYEKILGKINESDCVEDARKLLHIIVAAARPLEVQEMNIALAIAEKLEKGGSCRSYDELDLDDEESFPDRIRNLCGLFVSIQDSKIYLIHQTAREFLISKNTNPMDSSAEVWKHSLNSDDSNFILTKICLSYLTFDEFNRQSARSWKDSTPMFLNYAAVHWTIHFQRARNEEERILKAILDVCDTRSNRFQIWFQEYTQYGRTRYGSSANVTDLLIASYFGLGKEIVKLMLKQNKTEINLRDNWGQTALSNSAEKGHTEVVKLLLEQNEIEVNLKDYNGQMALLWAAANGHIEVVKLLLERHEIEVNIQDKDGQTALSFAAANGHTEVVKLLLKRNEIKVNIQDEYDRTALSRAIEEGHFELVKLLLERNEIEVNIQDKYGRTALSRAAERRHTEMVKLLLEQNEIEVNIQDKYGQTALSWAVEEGHVEVVKLLLEWNEVEVNLRDNYGRTALLLAEAFRHNEVVNLLLERKEIEVNLQDNYGRTALSLAAANRNIEVVELLLERNEIEVNLHGNSGQTVLSKAAEEGHTEVVKLLLERNEIEVNLQDIYGRTALSKAAEEGHTEVVKLLLERNEIQVNLHDNSGQTALAAAVEKRHIDVVKLLLERREIQVNPQDDYICQTALSWAAENGHTEVVKLLLERNGIKVNLKDDKSRTALSWAALNGRTEVVKLLLERNKIEVNIQDKYDRTALSKAAIEGHTEVVKLLLERNEIEVNLNDVNNRTALSWAAEKGHTEVVKLLLERNEIEVNLNDVNNRTALSWAAEKGHTEVVKLLLERNEIEVTLKDDEGRTALFWAADKLRLLSDEIEANLMDVYHRTAANNGPMALSLAAANGSIEVVELLLERNEYRGQSAGQ